MQTLQCGLVAVLLLLAVAAVVRAVTFSADRSALLDFYNSTNGPDWLPACSWSTSLDPCDVWYGVGCVGDRVVLVTLTGCGLSGTLPSFTGALTSLQMLAIHNNSIAGTLPALWSFPQLSFLSVEANRLTGTLPSEWNFPNMTHLTLQDNLLSGTLPDSWGYRMRKLDVLGLYNNSLSGTLPVSWGNFTLMEVIRLQQNFFSGTLPASWASMNPGSLSLSENRLTGTLPPQWSAMSYTQSLWLGENMLVGPLPASWQANNVFPVILELYNNCLADLYAASSWWKTRLLRCVVFPQSACTSTHSYSAIASLDTSQTESPSTGSTVEVSNSGTFSMDPSHEGSTSKTSSAAQSNSVSFSKTPTTSTESMDSLSSVSAMPVYSKFRSVSAAFQRNLTPTSMSSYTRPGTSASLNVMTSSLSRSSTVSARASISITFQTVSKGFLTVTYRKLPQESSNSPTQFLTRTLQEAVPLRSGSKTKFTSYSTTFSSSASPLLPHSQSLSKGLSVSQSSCSSVPICEIHALGDSDGFPFWSNNGGGPFAAITLTAGSRPLTAQPLAFSSIQQPSVLSFRIPLQCDCAQVARVSDAGSLQVEGTDVLQLLEVRGVPDVRPSGRTGVEVLLNASQWLPNEWSAYKPATLRVTITLGFGTSNVNSLHIRVPVQPEPLPGVAEMVTAAGYGAQWASVVAPPASATTVGRLTVSRLVALCEVSDDGSAGNGGLLSLSVGTDERLARDVGAIVGNFLIVASAALLLMTLSVAYFYRRSCSLREAFCRLALPSSLLLPWLATLPTTTFALVRIISRLNDAAHTPVVLLAVVHCVGPLICLGTVPWYWANVFNLQLVQSSTQHHLTQSPRCAARLVELWKSTRHRTALWHSDNTVVWGKDGYLAAQSLYVVLEEHTWLWYPVVDAALLSVTAALAGMTTVDTSGRSCRYTSVLVVFFYVGQVVLCVVMKPFTTQFSYASAVALQVLTSVSCVLQCVFVLSGSEGSGVDLSWALVGSSVVELMVLSTSFLRFCLVDGAHIFRALRMLVLALWNGSLAPAPTPQHERDEPEEEELQHHLVGSQQPEDLRCGPVATEQLSHCLDDAEDADELRPTLECDNVSVFLHLQENPEQSRTADLDRFYKELGDDIQFI